MAVDSVGSFPSASWDVRVSEPVSWSMELVLPLQDFYLAELESWGRTLLRTQIILESSALQLVPGTLSDVLKVLE